LQPVENLKKFQNITKTEEKKNPEFSLNKSQSISNQNYSQSENFSGILNASNQFLPSNHLNQSNTLYPSAKTTNMTNNLSTNNYYNPNVNSYINIVTINLGCTDEKFKKENNFTNTYTNNIDLINNNIDLNPDNSVNTSNNHINNNVNSLIMTDMQTDNENIKKILPPKLMLYEYQKYLKKKANNSPSVQGTNNHLINPTANSNVITNSNYLNITNGECNIISPLEKEQEKELNINNAPSNDPFKISFEDSFGGYNTQNLAEDNDIHKLNLDLDHFFNMDNL
jgi:hypothetical protein